MTGIEEAILKRTDCICIGCCDGPSAAAKVPGHVSGAFPIPKWLQSISNWAPCYRYDLPMPNLPSRAFMQFRLGCLLGKADLIGPRTTIICGIVPTVICMLLLTSAILHCHDRLGCLHSIRQAWTTAMEAPCALSYTYGRMTGRQSGSVWLPSCS